MYPDILFQYGQVIRSLRQSRNISQEKLGDLCGLHRTYISDIELGKRNVSLENIERMATALNVRISEIFTEVEKHESV